MALENFIDTLLNLWVFAFIGILVWLYFKKESDANKAESQERDIESWAYKLFSYATSFIIAKYRHWKCTSKIVDSNIFPLRKDL